MIKILKLGLVFFAELRNPIRELARQGPTDLSDLALRNQIGQLLTKRLLLLSAPHVERFVEPQAGK